MQYNSVKKQFCVYEALSNTSRYEAFARTSRWGHTILTIYIVMPFEFITAVTIIHVVMIFQFITVINIAMEGFIMFKLGNNITIWSDIRIFMGDKGLLIILVYYSKGMNVSKGSKLSSLWRWMLNIASTDNIQPRENVIRKKHRLGRRKFSSWLDIGIPAFHDEYCCLKLNIDNFLCSDGDIRPIYPCPS